MIIIIFALLNAIVFGRVCAIVFIGFDEIIVIKCEPRASITFVDIVTIVDTATHCTGCTHAVIVVIAIAGMEH